MSEMADGNGGALTTRERLHTIEAVLGRIELKLDNKADKESVARIGVRLGDVEAGETPVARLLTKQFEEVRARTDALWERGSSHAQEALQAVHEVARTVDSLREEQTQRIAVAKADRDAAFTKYRFWGLLVAVLSVGFSAAGLFLGFVSTLLTILYLAHVIT